MDCEYNHTSDGVYIPVYVDFSQLSRVALDSLAKMTDWKQFLNLTQPIEMHAVLM